MLKVIHQSMKDVESEKVLPVYNLPVKPLETGYQQDQHISHHGHYMNRDRWFALDIFILIVLLINKFYV